MSYRTPVGPVSRAADKNTTLTRGLLGLRYDVAMRELRRPAKLNFELPKPSRLQWLLFAPALALAAGQLAAWSDYWWIGGRVQAAAEEGARAALAGQDPATQEALARRAAARRLPGDDLAQASRVTVHRRPDGLLVQVSYDASDRWIHVLRPVLPTPPRTVIKTAVAPMP